MSGLGRGRRGREAEQTHRGVGIHNQAKAPLRQRRQRRRQRRRRCHGIIPVSGVCGVVLVTVWGRPSAVQVGQDLVPLVALPQERLCGGSVSAT
jgi:hypothetical protein